MLLFCFQLRTISPSGSESELRFFAVSVWKVSGRTPAPTPWLSPRQITLPPASCRKESHIRRVNASYESSGGGSV